VSSNPTSTSTGRAGRRIPLRSRRGRTALAGAAVLVALPVLAACSAGSSPQVYQIQPDNGEGKSGYMYISNVWVVLRRDLRRRRGHRPGGEHRPDASPTATR
jgi:hypothetical protein